MRDLNFVALITVHLCVLDLDDLKSMSGPLFTCFNRLLGVWLSSDCVPSGGSSSAPILTRASCYTCCESRPSRARLARSGHDMIFRPIHSDLNTSRSTFSRVFLNEGGDTITPTAFAVEWLTGTCPHCKHLLCEPDDVALESHLCTAVALSQDYVALVSCSGAPFGI